MEESRDDSWDLVAPRYEHDAVLLDDGRVLLGGGFTGVANNNVIFPSPLGLVEIYDPESDTWSALDPVEGPGYMYSLVKLADGRVLAFGVGVAGDDVESMAAAFEPATNSWSELTGSPFAIRAFPYVLPLNGGRLLVAGGVDFFSDPSSYSVEYVRGSEIFDPVTGDWSRAASPTETFQPIYPRDQPLLLLLADGRVAILGSEATDERRDVPRAETYDPSTDTWTPVSGLDPLYGFLDGVALSDGRLLVKGRLSESAVRGTLSDRDSGKILNVTLRDGEELNAEEITERFPTFKVYDPVADTWTPTGEPAYSRTIPTLTLLPDGRVLAVGGEDGWASDSDKEGSAIDDRSRYRGGAPLNLPHSTTEIYDPLTNTWALGPDLSELRLGSTATVLLDGRVLLAGGIGMVLDKGEIYPLPTSEIVDPDGPAGTAP